MAQILIALLLLLVAPEINAAECGSTINRPGCVNLNGSSSYNNNGAGHANPPYRPNQAEPEANIHALRGNTTSKALQSRCAFVSGKRVCG